MHGDLGSCVRSAVAPGKARPRLRTESPRVTASLRSLHTQPRSGSPDRGSARVTWVGPGSTGECAVVGGDSQRHGQKMHIGADGVKLGLRSPPRLGRRLR